LVWLVRYRVWSNMLTNSVLYKMKMQGNKITNSMKFFLQWELDV
jgi:hypothetical protein